MCSFSSTPALHLSVRLLSRLLMHSEEEVTHGVLLAQPQTFLDVTKHKELEVDRLEEEPSWEVKQD